MPSCAGICERALIAIMALAIFTATARAQQEAVPRRITQAIDENNRTVLRGNTHPLARTEFDRGAAPPNLLLQRMLLVLQRSPAQEAALDTLLEQQQDPASPNFHHWLTPGQFGRQFGPADQDVQSIVAWLNSHGLQVNRISSGRTVLEFSGTASQLQEAFHTEIHNYKLDGEDHWANSRDPEIPSALRPVIAGIASLNNFRKHAMYRLAGGVSPSGGRSGTSTAGPDLTIVDCAYNPLLRTAIPCYMLGPYDFATIYNVLPLWNANPAIDGTGVTIGIVGRTNINVEDANGFRSYFGLPANPPQVILDGPDPGLVAGDELEALLDVEWSGGVAKGAAVKLVASESTETTDGVDLSALYIVDNNLADVMSTSYGECELFLGAAGNQFYSNLWQQAAAQGITAFVSSGDSGSAGCDVFQGLYPQPAQYGLQVNGLASTPYNVAVGGTDFSQLFNLDTYWNPTNDPVTQASAKGYIPETTWNQSCSNAILVDPRVGYGTDPESLCNSTNIPDFTITLGASGGLSNCTAPTGITSSSCAGGYSKPAWQSGPGVPNDGKRDLPDVSLFASAGFQGSFSAVCGVGCGYLNVIGVGGTSVSSPAFAGLLALVNQKTGSREGNANYSFYKLAANQQAANCNASAQPAPTCIFNDIKSGTIAMPCVTGLPNCVTSHPGDAIGILSGYSTAAGYDLATGLGSVNASNMVQNWGAVGTATSTTALVLNGGSAVNITHGSPVSFAASVSPASPQPTGNIQLLALPGGASRLVGAYTLSAGAASGTTNLLPGGASYSVQAHYPGDATYAPSDSNAITVTVIPEPSSTTVHLVTFDPFNGQVLSENATSIPYGSVNLLRMDITNSTGVGCFTSGSGNVAYACPTGTVALTDNGAPLDAGSFALNSQGYAEDQSFPALTTGTHLFAGDYSGDNNYTASSGSTSVLVTPAPMIGGTGGDQIRAVIDAPFTITAAGRTTNPGNYPTRPGGTFAMFEGSAPVPITQYSLTGILYPYPNAPYVYKTIEGILTATLSGPPGPHTFTTQYSGDENYQGFTSQPFVVTEVYSTQTQLSSSAPTIPYGQSVTLTAQVVPSQLAGTAPTGTITFSLNGNSIGNAAVVGGEAQITTATLSGGSNVITATYSGDSNYATSSAAFTQTVTPLSTTLALTAPTPFVSRNDSVTYTAVVTPSQAGPAAPTGRVLFTFNGHPIANPLISNNQAQWAYPLNDLGPNQVQAAYSGDQNYAASSATLTVTVGSLFISPSATTILVPAPGQSGSIVLTIIEQGGLVGSAPLSPSACEDLPPASTCSFSPPMLTFSASQTTATVTLTVTTTAAGSLGPAARKFSPNGWLGIVRTASAWACVFSVLLLVVAFRRRWVAVLALAGFLIAVSAAGCGGGGGGLGGGGGGGGGAQGTRPGIYPGMSVIVSFNGVWQALTNITVDVR